MGGVVDGVGEMILGCGCGRHPGFQEICLGFWAGLCVATFCMYIYIYISAIVMYLHLHVTIYICDMALYVAMQDLVFSYDIPAALHNVTWPHVT